jgi:hypothetical protein
VRVSLGSEDHQMLEAETEVWITLGLFALAIAAFCFVAAVLEAYGILLARLLGIPGGLAIAYGAFAAPMTDPASVGELVFRLFLMMLSIAVAGASLYRLCKYGVDAAPAGEYHHESHG